MITPGQKGRADDFINKSERDATPANDAGRVAKLETNGKIAKEFLGNSKFGGDGLDGPLAINSGVTTIDLGGQALVIKNYTSISITGTGRLEFSNPHARGTRIILRSQGDVTMTSSATPNIDLRNLGAAAGNVAYAGTYFVTSAGETGSGFLAGGSAPAVTGGSISFSPTNPDIDLIGMRYPFMHMASMGGQGGLFTANGGGTSSATPSSPGRGAGSLIIECAGALNFTGTIYAQGSNGVDGAASASGGGTAASGGSGGGGGGFVGIFYDSLVSASGTITITGGTGSLGKTSGSGNANAQGGSGGGGKKPGGNISALVVGSGNNANGGATGGDGFALVAKNTELS